MKKIIILFAILLSAYNIKLVNAKTNYFDINSIPKKYTFTIKKKTYFDKKPHIYTVITLQNFVHLFAPKAKKVTFYAYDHYVISFDKKEINDPNIVFAFLEDGKKIPIENRGPAKIIYIKKTKNKDYIFKSIFLIKKVKFE